MNKDMHSRSREVISYLDGRHADLRQATAAVPSALRSLRPAVDQWSVAEILEHLVLIEGPLERYLSSVWIAHVRAGRLARERENSPICPSFNFDRLLDRTRARKSLPCFRPLGTVGFATSMRLLEATRAKLRATLTEASGFAWGDANITYPALDGLTMNVYHWVLWLGSHECRHTGQIRDVQRALLLSQPHNVDAEGARG